MGLYNHQASGVYTNVSNSSTGAIVFPSWSQQNVFASVICIAQQVDPSENTAYTVGSATNITL